MNVTQPRRMPSSLLRYASIALFGSLIASPSLRAQLAPAPNAPPAGQKETAPAKVTPLTESAPADSEVVELSPFVVTGSQDNGYQATSTLAGTRLNTDLKDIGAAVSVYTQEFLADIGATKLEEILTYTASTEAAGQNGNFSGIAGESSAEVREDPAAINRVRALAQATRTRDFFASDIPSDTYSFDTLTINRGPNAILAGVGNAGGVIDAAMRKPTFKDNYRVVSRFSSYESHREEVHLNKVVIPKRLAVRLDLLNDDRNYRQEPAYNTDQRLYAALNYRLFEPKRGGFLGRGTLRANYETGKIEGVPPDPLTPTFAVDNWFNSLNPKWTWNGARARLETIAGVPITGTSATNGVIRGFPLYTQWALVYANPSSNAAGVGFSQPSLANIQGFQGTIPASLAGSPGGSVSSTGDPNRLRTGYVRNHLSNPAVFNFYDELMTGAFDFRKQDFDATDIRYEQLFLDGDAGLELAYNDQTFTTVRDFSIPTGGNDEGILIDVNSVLSIRSPEFPNGIPNPNFGRPFITTSDVFRDQFNRTTRESKQATAFIKHDFTQSDSDWAKWFGRHTFSSLFFQTNIDRFNRTYSSTWDPAGSPSPQSSLNGAQPATFSTQVNGWFYLGPSMVNAATANDIRLERITAERPVAGQTYTLRVYDPAARTFVTSTAKPLRVLQRLVDQREELDSMAFALQSHWLKNYLVTVVGWREDKDQAYTSVAPDRLADGSVNEATKTFQPSAAQLKRSWTKSVVGRLPVKLPFGSELRAHWNDSGNFNPVGQRRNIWNEEIGSPTANTREKGASISMFDGKFALRVNRYTTAIQNDSVANVGNPYSYVSALITRLIASRDAGLLPANWGYVYPGWNSFSDVALAVYDTLPARFRANIGASKNFNPRFTGSGNTLQWTPESIINLASTSNTESTGTEYEAIINPVKGWRISLSVAQTEAVKANVAVEELAWADEWKKNLDSMFNGKLLPGSRAPGTTTLTFFDQYNAEALPSIRTASRLSGSKAPEIREWRANLVTRYEFQSGALRGFGLGGAVRWQDKIGIGYPYIVENGLTVADIKNPYYGSAETAFDANLSYKRRFKVMGSTVNWSIFVSMTNLNAKDELIPIRANPDGTWGTFRIPPERTWSVSNTFTF